MHRDETCFSVDSKLYRILSSRQPFCHCLKMGSLFSFFGFLYHCSPVFTSNSALDLMNGTRVWYNFGIHHLLCSMSILHLMRLQAYADTWCQHLLFVSLLELFKLSSPTISFMDRNTPSCMAIGKGRWNQYKLGHVHLLRCFFI